MDLICTRCGEPWDVYHVMHDAEPGDFTRKNGLIVRCPACPAKKVKLDSKQRETVEMLADMTGDDIDGLAAELDDLF